MHSLNGSTHALAPAAVRYEVMPFGSATDQAAQLATPLRLSVTCSPKHGVDHTVEFAAGLRKLGHVVTCHIAARMVEGQDHLDELLARMHDVDIHDVFLVGGDQQRARGPYARALDLLPAVKESANAPQSVGIPAYPEGHPLIDAAVLADDLRQKSELADYMVTQMCFDSTTIVEWLERTREQGVYLPAILGIPGMVDRRRLLEISLRVGVGTSVSFLQKQHGAVSRLFGHGRHDSERLVDELAPMVGRVLGVEGLHVFTFNRLVDAYNLIECQSRSAAAVA